MNEVTTMDSVRMTVVDLMHVLFLGLCSYLFETMTNAKVFSPSVFKRMQKRMNQLGVPRELGRTRYRFDSRCSQVKAEEVRFKLNFVQNFFNVITELNTTVFFYLFNTNQWRNIFQIFLPFLLDGCLKYKYEQHEAVRRKAANTKKRQRRPLVPHGSTDSDSDSEAELEDFGTASRKGTFSKKVDNPDYEKHRMLFVLLGNVVKLLSLRVTTTVALYEAQDLLIRYGLLFNECFPKASPASKGGVVANFHFAIHHLVGKHFFIYTS
jgi:hypothetical protein